MKLARQSRRRRGRIEIIPMIDVMFFLLASFMLASLTMRQLDSIPLELPHGQTQSISGAKAPTLSIDAANHLFLDHQPVQLSEVASHLRAVLPVDGAVVIAADSHALHGVVVQAMLRAREAGAASFLIALDASQAGPAN